MNAEKAVIGYFEYKNIDNRGFLRYGFFKRIIGYVLDYYHDYFIRKTFLALVNKGYFIRYKTTKQSYRYKFNPTPKIPPKQNNIDPSIFVVSWD